MESEEEQDCDWFCALQPVLVRAAPRESAARRGVLVAGQRIQVRPGQVQDSEGKSWIRLTLQELWRSCRATSRSARGFVALADAGGFPLFRRLSAGECPRDSEQLVGFLRWWPLDPLPPVQPATFGGAWLCRWQASPQESIKAKWLAAGELQLVGPAETKAGEVCQWLEDDIGFGADFSVLLIQDLPGLCRCAPLTSNAAMRGVAQPFCAISQRRPRLCLAREGPLREILGWAPEGAPPACCAFDAESQVSEHVLASFEALSQLMEELCLPDHMAPGVVFTVTPGELPLPEVIAHAFGFSAAERETCRLKPCTTHSCFDWAEKDAGVHGESNTLSQKAAVASARRRADAGALLADFGTLCSFEVEIARVGCPVLYCARNDALLGKPVLGIAAVRCYRQPDPEPDEPPPLAPGLAITLLQGLSGDSSQISASRSWTVRELKEVIKKETGIPEHQQRLVLASSQDAVEDHHILGDLSPEAGLSLQLLCLEPRWAAAWQCVGEEPEAWEDLEEDLQRDRDLILLAVSQRPALLRGSGFTGDAEVVLAAASKDSSLLDDADHHLWLDDFFAEAASVYGAAALRSAGAAQRALRGEEVNSSGPEWKQLAAKHRELAKAALSQDGRALEALDVELRADAELVRIATENDARALQFATEDLRDDADLVLAAIQRRGQVLRWASARLRADRDIVLAAIEQDPRAVLFASEELARDKEVLLAAMSKDPCLAVHLANVARGIA
ncbi:Dnaaf1 [Symbiodinium natans]|uniref:Dnaaf1 protein n=1 Tax=Symbiodinium natans TaxID=878477 RepID=A0A812S2T8_9DINO|nr:Dnaaf1 [Symbiodinium natans]